ncbi:hypothetical protein F751_1525 [Auxenochlorella protothecoides]|uniref:Uncharacterized protein n=1 Tax=Auxenochlorella protothecoides TaxID=3075 RepID=A0A087SFM9_AUXPR|nr:hypothetical protein F751_1525 [Auxenochlorella protothecoides]KFM24533.1 hypothetical protein F751_1525 [Auxenochlorella protothecoides]
MPSCNAAIFANQKRDIGGPPECKHVPMPDSPAGQHSSGRHRSSAEPQVECRAERWGAASLRLPHAGDRPWPCQQGMCCGTGIEGTGGCRARTRCGVADSGWS